jgi:hypothetical protein
LLLTKTKLLQFWFMQARRRALTRASAKSKSTRVETREVLVNRALTGRSRSYNNNRQGNREFQSMTTCKNTFLQAVKIILDITKEIKVPICKAKTLLFSQTQAS